MQFIDLHSQQFRIKDKIDAGIQQVLKHGNYIMGPEVIELEKLLAKYVGIKHAISCASGTDALLLALMAYGIGPGDAVLTSPFTFIATAEVISLLGATPVFVDIDSQSFNIDSDKLKEALEKTKASSLNPKGIIAVDLFGLPADYDAINSIAKENSLFVIEDAAQSFGGVYKDRMTCSLADIACTSFFPAKPLGCYGDGGMCFTNNDQMAETIRSIRIHGKGTHKYDNVRIGINGRLDTIQAAILLAKFAIFPEEVELRQQVARKYTDQLNSNLKSIVSTPVVPDTLKSAWAQYSVLTVDEQERTKLLSKLKGAGIPAAIYYPKPLHLQSAYSHLNYTEGSFPVSEEISCRIFSIPMHPYLSPENQEKVIKAMTQ